MDRSVFPLCPRVSNFQWHPTVLKIVGGFNCHFGKSEMWAAVEIPKNSTIQAWSARVLNVRCKIRHWRYWNMFNAYSLTFCQSYQSSLRKGIGSANRVMVLFPKFSEDRPQNSRAIKCRWENCLNQKGHRKNMRHNMTQQRMHWEQASDQKSNPGHCHCKWIKKLYAPCNAAFSERSSVLQCFHSSSLASESSAWRWENFFQLWPPASGNSRTTYFHCTSWVILPNPHIEPLNRRFGTCNDFADFPYYSPMTIDMGLGSTATEPVTVAMAEGFS